MLLPATQKRQQSLKEKQIDSNGMAKIEKARFFPTPTLLQKASHENRKTGDPLPHIRHWAKHFLSTMPVSLTNRP